jgi:hypothetical protein
MVSYCLSFGAVDCCCGRCCHSKPDFEAKRFPLEQVIDAFRCVVFFILKLLSLVICFLGSSSIFCWVTIGLFLADVHSLFVVGAWAVVGCRFFVNGCFPTGGHLPGDGHFPIIGRWFVDVHSPMGGHVVNVHHFCLFVFALMCEKLCLSLC